MTGRDGNVTGRDGDVTWQVLLERCSADVASLGRSGNVTAISEMVLASLTSLGD